MLPGEILALIADEEDELELAASLERESSELQTCRTLMWQAFLK